VADARYDPARGRFAGLRLTPSGTAEATALTRLDAGQTVVTGRGDPRVRNIQAVLEAGSHELTRIGWRLLALADEIGRAFDLFAYLPRGLAAAHHLVRLKGVTQPITASGRDIDDDTGAHAPDSRGTPNRGNPQSTQSRDVIR